MIEPTEARPTWPGLGAPGPQGYLRPMDLFALIAAERRRLADELEHLSADEWQQPSLCEGWSTHVVAAHLNMAWEFGLPATLVAIVRNRGNIDRAFDQLSRDLADRLTPEQCIAGLRANAANRFTPPMMGAEAPLTDVIVHGNDILAPLGRSVEVSPEALGTSLAWLAARATPRASCPGHGSAASRSRRPMSTCPGATARPWCRDRRWR